nr:unnamed protein product [Spirometra erinaceieuropaei]
MVSDSRGTLKQCGSRRPQKQHITFASHAESVPKSSKGGLHPLPVSTFSADSTGDDVSEEDDECRWRSETESLRNCSNNNNDQVLFVQIPKNGEQRISKIRPNQSAISHWKRAGSCSFPEPVHPPLAYQLNGDILNKPTKAAEARRTEDKDKKGLRNGAGGMAEGARVKGLRRGGTAAEASRRTADAAWERGPPNRLPLADEKQTPAAAEAARTAVRMMLESRYGNSTPNVFPPPKKRGEESVVWQPVDHSRNHYNPLTAMQGCKVTAKPQAETTNSQSQRSSKTAHHIDARSLQATKEPSPENTPVYPTKHNVSGNPLVGNRGNLPLVAESSFGGPPKVLMDEKVGHPSVRERFHTALSRFTNNEIENGRPSDVQERDIQQAPKEAPPVSANADPLPTQKGRDLELGREHEVLRPKQLWRTKSIGRTSSEKKRDEQSSDHSSGALLFPKKYTDESIELLEAKNIILKFCQLNTKEYIHQGVEITNFSTSWEDGTALCALVHHFFPTAFDFYNLKNVNKQEKIKLALSTAQ